MRRRPRGVRGCPVDLWRLPPGGRRLSPPTGLGRGASCCLKTAQARAIHICVALRPLRAVPVGLPMAKKTPAPAPTSRKKAMPRTKAAIAAVPPSSTSVASKPESKGASATQAMAGENASSARSVVRTARSAAIRPTTPAMGASGWSRPGGIGPSPRLLAMAESPTPRATAAAAVPGSFPRMSTGLELGAF